MKQKKQLSPFLDIRVGATVSYCSNTYVITNLLDIERVLAKNCLTGTIQCLRIAELHPVQQTNDPSSIAAHSGTIPDESWEKAMHKFEVIRPLLNSNHSRMTVDARASQYNLSPMTVYRWIAEYQTTGLVSSLVRKARSDKGKSRLTPEIEDLIQKIIKEFYLNKQRYTPETVIQEVRMYCRKMNIKPPANNTIRNRIQVISEEEVLTRRKGRKEAQQRFSPIDGSFPGADYPLAIVQIDHTPMDLIVVDEILRRPIGKPWLTLAIDVFSRMVCGFYISMDPPSTMSVALCLAHAILPKEKWLANRDLALPWPLWGVPNTIHADNAKEFRGKSLQRACQEYSIDLTWRPVATPNYGGHIERYLGTVSKKLHELPGTTFSNIKERGEYDSEGKAIMTLKELEIWLAVFILGQYHQNIHSEIGMPPIKKFEQGIIGTDEQLGRGMPPRLYDENRVLLDFMPMIERTIQNYGVAFENIQYYAQVLRPWINASNPQDPKTKRKFIFRYDPRDISILYFLDPELNIFYPIPYRNTARPPISIWELREAIKKAKEDYNIDPDENLIFSSYEKLREIERKAAKETKQVRRNIQRKLDKNGRPDYLPSTNITKTTTPTTDTSNETPSSSILPFEDIDEEIEP